MTSAIFSSKIALRTYVYLLEHFDAFFIADFYSQIKFTENVRNQQKGWLLSSCGQFWAIFNWTLQIYPGKFAGFWTQSFLNVFLNFWLQNNSKSTNNLQKRGCCIFSIHWECFGSKTQQCSCQKRYCIARSVFFDCFEFSSLRNLPEIVQKLLWKEQNFECFEFYDFFWVHLMHFSIIIFFSWQKPSEFSHFAPVWTF